MNGQTLLYQWLSTSWKNGEVYENRCTNEYKLYDSREKG